MAMGLVKYLTPEAAKDAKNKSQYKYKKSQKYWDSYTRNHVKRKYGITLEEYNSLLRMQNNKCAICKCEDQGRDYSDGRRKQYLPLCVDHDHSTKKVRGLLCNKCNAGIGMLKDSIEIVTNALNYLMENKS